MTALEELGMERHPARGDPCAFCGRDDVKTADGPTVSICLDCAQNAVAALEPI